jgi:hypothetical protein
MGKWRRNKRKQSYFCMTFNDNSMVSNVEHKRCLLRELVPAI